MKTLIILLASVLILYSCAKSGTEREGIDYSPFVGNYHATNGDTATVSVNGEMLRVRYAAKNTFALRCVLDSVRMNSDNSFTCNEYTMNNLNMIFPVVGGGWFGENTVSFHVVVGAGTNVNFTGIKKQ